MSSYGRERFEKAMERKMRKSKVFCIRCETIQRPTSKCLKCNSINTYSLGDKDRFPKHPKKSDYEYLFNIFTGKHYKYNEINYLKNMHKYISNHKHRNVIAANGKSFKENIDNRLKKAMVIINEFKKVHTFDSYPMWGHRDKLYEIKGLMNNLCKVENTVGYIVPAVGILLDGDSFDATVDKNHFKPVKGRGHGTRSTFKTEKDAKLFSTYMAKELLSELKREDKLDKNFIKYMKRTAGKTKLKLKHLYPELFI